MREKRSTALSWTFLLALTAHGNTFGQSNFLYDQQSSDENNLGGGLADIQSNQPIGQSFTPSLAFVGFVRLYLSDNAFNVVGTSVLVNLRTNSVSGPVLASTSAVAVADHFHGTVDFTFSSAVPVSPGATYYFQPSIQSGESFSVYQYNFLYPGGTLFLNGTAITPNDMWFREGIFVPEPSLVSLGLLAATLVPYARKNRKRS
jgi:hypothetical protein